MSDKINVITGTESDIEEIVELSYKKRREYEKIQPQFWKWAGEDGEKIQAKWFRELMQDERHIVLCAKSNERTIGFAIGKLIPSPEVYNPGGLTLMVDDFCIENGLDWKNVGGNLIKEIKIIAKAKGASQILVVCGAHDHPKRKFLRDQNLSVASEWFIGGMV